MARRVFSLASSLAAASSSSSSIFTKLHKTPLVSPNFAIRPLTGNRVAHSNTRPARGLTQTQTPKPPIEQQKSSEYARGNFIDAFLMKMVKNKNLLANRKIWSRRSTIWPEFKDTSVKIYNGRFFVKCTINEGKVGHKFGEFALTRKRRPQTAAAQTKKKGKK